MKTYKEILEKVEVDTDKWSWSNNNKQPSGTGGWIFKIGNEEVSVYGSYASAKKQAIKIAKNKGERSITVMP